MKFRLHWPTLFAVLIVVGLAFFVMHHVSRGKSTAMMTGGG